jgi:glutathione peroxidase
LGTEHLLSRKKRKVNSYFDIMAKTIEGKVLKLGDLCRNKKVTLIVNVASKSGFTKNNYAELIELYEKHKNNGFQIIAWPCNDFG